MTTRDGEATLQTQHRRTTSYPPTSPTHNANELRRRGRGANPTLARSVSHRNMAVLAITAVAFGPVANKFDWSISYKFHFNEIDFCWKSKLGKIYVVFLPRRAPWAPSLKYVLNAFCFLHLILGELNFRCRTSARFNFLIPLLQIATFWYRYPDYIVIINTFYRLRR